MYSSLRSSSAAMVAAEIMPRSATTHSAEMKAFAQPIDDRHQHPRVGDVARQHLGANRPALAVDDNGEDHLLQVWPVILRMAVGPKAVGAGAVEGETGGVHEDQ